MKHGLKIAGSALAIALTVGLAPAAQAGTITWVDPTDGVLSSQDLPGAVDDTFAFTTSSWENVTASATANLLPSNGKKDDIVGLTVTLDMFNGTSYVAVPGVTDLVNVGANVGPGMYELVVTGTATGSVGGNYSGDISLAAVPLPAALPMFGAGLAGFGAFARRRRTNKTA